jgi:hypothetical protein
MRSGYGVMGLKDRLRLAELAVEPGVKEIETDRWTMRADPDGVVRDTCWFCNEEVEFRPTALTGDVAIIAIRMLGTHEHLHGVCHTTCGQRSKGSLSA